MGLGQEKLVHPSENDQNSLQKYRRLPTPKGSNLAQRQVCGGRSAVRVSVSNTRTARSGWAGAMGGKPEPPTPNPATIAPQRSSIYNGGADDFNRTYLPASPPKLPAVNEAQAHGVPAEAEHR